VAIFGKGDAVSAARTDLEAAEEGLRAAVKRREAAEQKADAFVAEAGASVAGDDKADARAARELAELRAGADLQRSREAAAAAKVEAARVALAAAEAAAKLARIAEIDAQIAEREPKAIEAARVALAALDAAAVELAKLAAEANTIGHSLAPAPHKARGVRGLAPFAGNPIAAPTTLREGRLL